jgi:hypothetical protein
MPLGWPAPPTWMLGHSVTLQGGHSHKGKGEKSPPSWMDMNLRLSYFSFHFIPHGQEWEPRNAHAGVESSTWPQTPWVLSSNPVLAALLGLDAT